jgi:hypothetical protein
MNVSNDRNFINTNTSKIPAMYWKFLRSTEGNATRVRIRYEIQIFMKEFTI